MHRSGVMSSPRGLRPRANRVVGAVVIVAALAGLAACQPRPAALSIRSDHSGSVAEGTAVVLSGRLNQARSDGSVAIERLVGRQWRPQARGSLSGTGAYRIALRPTSLGGYRLRARWVPGDGSQAVSSSSLAFTVVPPPGSPTQRPGDVTASAGDRQSVVKWSAPAAGGPATTRYLLQGPAGSFTTSGLEATVSGLTNGTAYAFSVRACNSVGCGPTAATPSVVPFGNPGTPSVTVTAQGQTLRWTWSAPDGNGRPVTRYRLRLDGALIDAAFQATTFERTFKYSEYHTLAVTAVNSGGRESSPGSAVGLTTPGPSVSAAIAKGSPVTTSDCTHPSCAYIQVTLVGMDTLPHVVQCWAGGSTFAAYTTRFPLSARCYYGVPGQDVYVIVDGAYESNHLTW